VSRRVAALACGDDVVARVSAAVHARYQVLSGNIAPHWLKAVEAQAALLSAGTTSKKLKLKVRCPHGELLRLNLEVPGYASRALRAPGIALVGGCA
jgi:hypothetical protein